MSDFEALVRAALHINASHDQETMATHILEAAREVLEAEAASLMLVEGECLKWLAALGSAGAVLVNQDLALGEGIAGWVAASGETVLANDAASDDRFCDRIDALSGFSTRSILCVPLVAHGRILGVLELINRAAAEAFDPQDVRQAQAFASLAAVALENARLVRVAEEMGNLREITRFKNEMASVVAQELRGPLTTIRGFSEMVRDDASLQLDDARRFSGLIVDETKRCERLIEEFLRLSRIEHATLREEEVSLSEVAQGCAARRQDAATACPIRVLCNGGVRVLADGTAVGQILDELLGNAVRFSPEGGAVDVSADREGAVWRIRVRDHGMGVPGDAVPRLFHHFYRVPGPRRPSGTGLGLTIVRALVDRMGGQVGYEPAEVGSVFWFTLPAAD